VLHPFPTGYDRCNRSVAVVLSIPLPSIAIAPPPVSFSFAAQFAVLKNGAETMLILARSFAVTLPSVIEALVTEFFGAFLALIAMAVDPPPTATTRASVATTFA